MPAVTAAMLTVSATVLAQVAPVAVEPVAPATAEGPGRAGALAFDLAVGRGLTFAKGQTGRTSSGVAEPLLTRLGASFSLGAGLWLEGTLRGAMEGDLSGVRSVAATAGLRIETDREALLSVGLRLGYDALVAGRVSHGAYAAVAVNLRPWRGVVVFAEGCAEAWPGAGVERSTANDRAGDSYAVLAVISYLGGIRLSL